MRSIHDLIFGDVLNYDLVLNGNIEKHINIEGEIIYNKKE